MAMSEVSRRPHDLPGTAAAVGFICLGILLIVQTRSMTPMGSVFPIAVSAAMILSASVLILRNVVIGLRRKPAEASTEAEPEPEPAASPESNVRRLGFLAVMAAWIVMIPILGFFVASLVCYFAIMAVSLHQRTSLKEAAAMAVIGIAILGGFYLLMAEVLFLPLPRGLFF